MLKRFIFNRIETAVGHLLEDNQYGFRKGRSTLDAINQVVDKGKEAISGVRWKRGNRLGIPTYLKKLPGKSTTYI